MEPIEAANFLQDLFPGASDAVLALLAAAADNADLAASDFYTIRDLLELSGYSGPETLYVLLLIMLLALEEGSLCVEVSAAGLVRRLKNLTDEVEAQSWAERILADLGDPGFANLIGTKVDDSKPVIRHASGSRQYLYFQKFLHHERIFQASLESRLASKLPDPDLGKIAAALQEVLVEKPLRLEGRALGLDPRQKLALGLGLLRSFAVISGGPGTGKTSIVLTLLRCLVRYGMAPERIALAAPTGRAAQRLADALRSGLESLAPPLADADAGLNQLPAHTLHHLLRYNPARGSFGRHAENPIPADVVIVDEVSMVGVELMSRLLQALDPGSRLVLLGDKDQLPSVDAGAVLAGLVPEDSQPGFGPEVQAQLLRLFSDINVPPRAAGPDVVVVLEENYRSQQHIREVARAINRQDTEIVEKLPLVTLAGASANVFADLEQQGGCWLLPQIQATPGELRRTLEQWAEHQYRAPSPDLEAYHELVARCAGLKIGDDMPPEQQESLDQLFQALGRSRLLTLVREGPWGCTDINRFLEQHLRPRWDRIGRTGLFAGAPVLITRNDHVRGLYNGDVGVALRGPGGDLRVVFPRQGGYVALPADSLPAHELGFALTVHKSQGSEYGQVLLVLPPQGGRRLLTKELIYTAITRARKLAVLCGTKEVLKFAIGRRIERETGFFNLPNPLGI